MLRIQISIIPRLVPILAVPQSVQAAAGPKPCPDSPWHGLAPLPLLTVCNISMAPLLTQEMNLSFWG